MDPIVTSSTAALESRSVPALRSPFERVGVLGVRCGRDEAGPGFPVSTATTSTDGPSGGPARSRARGNPAASPSRSRGTLVRRAAGLLLLLCLAGSANAAAFKKLPERGVSLPNPVGGVSLTPERTILRGGAQAVPVHVDPTWDDVFLLPAPRSAARYRPSTSPPSPLSQQASGDPVHGRFRLSARVADDFEGEVLELQRGSLLRSPLTLDELAVGFDTGLCFTGLLEMDNVAQDEYRLRGGWDDWINLSMRASTTRSARYDPTSGERTWREEDAARFHLRKFRGVTLDGHWHHRSQNGPSTPADALWDHQEAGLALSTHAPAMDGRLSVWGDRFTDGNESRNRSSRSGFTLNVERDLSAKAHLRMHYDYAECRLEELDLRLSDQRASFVATLEDGFGFEGLDWRSHLHLSQRSESYVVNADLTRTFDAGLRFDYRHGCGANLSGGWRERQLEGYHLDRQAIERLISNPDTPRSEIEALRIEDAPHLSEIFLRGRIDHRRALSLNMEILERNHYALPRSDLVAAGSESLFFADRRRMRTRVDLFPRSRTTASWTKSWDLTRNVPWVGAPQIEQQVTNDDFVLLWHVMRRMSLHLQWSDFDLDTTDRSVSGPDGHRFDAFTGYGSYALRPHVDLFTEYSRYDADGDGSTRQSVLYVGVKTHAAEGKAAWRIALGRDVYEDRGDGSRSYGADLLNVSTEFAF